jgi:hypothetical protein
MKINIIETKTSSTNSISCGDNDKICEGEMMYKNKSIKFPKKKVPTNNQIFVSKSKAVKKKG